MPRRERNAPRAAEWLLSVLGLVLPWIAVPLAFAGVGALVRGNPLGWAMIGAGAVMLLVDYAIDLLLAHPSFAESDEPDLNNPPAQLVGRRVVVIEAIAGGRGRVRIGDTTWIVEGPDAPEGATVRIVGARGTVLEVVPV